MAKKKLYLISGLGANGNAFERLNLSEYECISIDWLLPEAGETLVDYSKRMAQKIDKNQEVNIVGLSFGGIIAQEIAAQLEVKKIVLLSSVKSRSELPILYRLSSYFALHRLIPNFLFNNSKLLSVFLLGKYRRDAYLLIEKFMTMRNIYYSKWAIDKIVNWKEPKIETPLLHLHGNRDGVFPIRYIKNAVVIEGGTHLMVYTKAATLSKKIKDFI